MTKPLPLLGALALVLAGCSPAPRSAPAPTPAPPDAPDSARPEARDPDPALEPDEALAAIDPEAKDRWWLLDPEQGFPGIGADLAYRDLIGPREPARTVVVAIIDSGVDVEHEDLDDVLWTNDDELPGNQVDDDGNGYVDDVHGWNFIGGPDGTHVEHDTYEITRIYRSLRHYEDADPDTLSATGREELERFREIEAEFRADREEARGQLAQVEQIDRAVDRIVAVLQAELGTDSLSDESVRSLRTLRPEVMQAREIYLNLRAQDYTPGRLKEDVEYLRGRLEYGLNPEYDPRGIVGDDYEDVDEREYGNARLEGPDASHGTHVAGIVAAERGNGVGIDGIASAARLMILRTVPDGDERDKDVANAIRYAADNGADIINMSFGKAYSPRKDAVDAAVRYAEERGVLLVHAAGNDAADLGEENNYPNRHYLEGGRARNWIEVGASSWSAPDSLAAPFSNYNRQEVDVFAPGVDILSTVPDDEYEVNSGTSMAAPVVSGLAALIMAYYPALSAADVREIILDSARRYRGVRVVRPGGSETVAFEELSATGGIVNARAALELAAERAGRR